METVVFTDCSNISTVYVHTSPLQRNNQRCYDETSSKKLLIPKASMQRNVPKFEFLSVVCWKAAILYATMHEQRSGQGSSGVCRKVIVQCSCAPEEERLKL